MRIEMEDGEWGLLSDMSDLQNVWKETDSSVLMKVDGKFAARTRRVHNACITLRQPMLPLLFLWLLLYLLFVFVVDDALAKKSAAAARDSHERAANAFVSLST